MLLLLSLSEASRARNKPLFFVKVRGVLWVPITLIAKRTDAEMIPLMVQAHHSLLGLHLGLDIVLKLP